MFLYANDDALYVSEKETNRIQEKLGEELVKVKDWSENKLLHLGKTESIYFGSKFNLHKVDDLALKVDEYVLANRASVELSALCFFLFLYVTFYIPVSEYLFICN